MNRKKLAPGGTRTPTWSPTVDFESIKSTKARKALKLLALFGFFLHRTRTDSIFLHHYGFYKIISEWLTFVNAY